MTPSNCAGLVHPLPLSLTGHRRGRQMVVKSARSKGHPLKRGQAWNCSSRSRPMHGSQRLKVLECSQRREHRLSLQERPSRRNPCRETAWAKRCTSSGARAPWSRTEEGCEISKHFLNLSSVSQGFKCHMYEGSRGSCPMKDIRTGSRQPTRRGTI
jgi:hypothetical protein